MSFIELINPNTYMAMLSTATKLQAQLVASNDGGEFQKWVNLPDVKLPKKDQDLINDVVAVLASGQEVTKTYTFTIKISESGTTFYSPVVMSKTNDDGHDTLYIFWGDAEIPLKLEQFEGEYSIFELKTVSEGGSVNFSLDTLIVLADPTNEDGKGTVEVNFEIPIIINKEMRDVAEGLLKIRRLKEHLKKGVVLDGLVRNKLSGDFPKKLEVFYDKNGTGQYKIVEAGSVENFQKTGFNQWVKLEGDDSRYLLKNQHCTGAFQDYQFKPGIDNYTLYITGCEDREFSAKGSNGEKIVKPYRFVLATVIYQTNELLLDFGDDIDFMLPPAKQPKPIETPTPAPKPAKGSMTPPAPVKTVETTAKPITDVEPLDLNNPDLVDDLPF